MKRAFSRRNSRAAPLPRVPGCRPAPHPRLEEREILDRPDVRVPLEELLLVPEQPIELGDVVRAEPAPEDELLRRRDRRDRVDLEEAEPADRVEDGRRRAVEELSADRDPPRLLRRDEPHRSDPLEPDRATQPIERALEGVVERAERRTPRSRWNALTTSVPSRRSDLRSARPTIRSRQRSGST